MAAAPSCGGTTVAWGTFAGSAPSNASFGTEADDLARYHQGPGQIDELWIIDVDGAVVILDAMYRPDTSAELIAEMRSIAESATFELP